MRRMFIIGGVIVIAATVVYALQDQNNVVRSTQISPTELQSDDWMVRFKVFAKIRGLDDDQTRGALVELLERENALASVLALSRHSVSLSQENGYSEYYTQVFRTVWRHTDELPNQRALVTLAYVRESMVAVSRLVKPPGEQPFVVLTPSNYNPESKFANWLAGQKTLIPTFLEMAKSNLSLDREKAVAILGKMFVGLRDLPEEVKQEIRQAIELAKDDPESFVRESANKALSKLNNEKPH